MHLVFPQKDSRSLHPDWPLGFIFRQPLKMSCKRLLDNGAVNKLQGVTLQGGGGAVITLTSLSCCGKPELPKKARVPSSFLTPLTFLVFITIS